MTVLSSPSSRAKPRTAVSVPSVTMKGGSLKPAIRPPLIAPQTRPVTSPAGRPSQPSQSEPGSLETTSATIAAAARIEPTERSMPEVRMTKVMPAASTTLIDACWAMMEMFWSEKKRSLRN